jgi:hypothetical protein
LANQPFSVTVQGPAETLGPNLIYNAGFDQGIAPWQRSTGRVPGALATVDQGVALLQAILPTVAGTLSVSQLLSHPGAVRPFLLRYRAIDDGSNATRLTALVRETLFNGTNLDTRFTSTPAREWQTINWTWTPRSASARSVAVFFQANVEPGRAQRVRIDDALLAPAPQVAWSAPGGVVATQSALRATVVFYAKGEQAVYANATDNGVTVWSAMGRFLVDNAPPAAALAPHPTATVNQPAAFDASGSLDPDAPLALRDLNFTALGTTWRTHAASIARATSATPLQDARGGVQVDILGARPNATAFVSQEVPLGRATAGHLAVTVQGIGDVASYSLVLREANATGRRDTGAAFPATRGRETVLDLPWTRQLPDATTLTVLLRFRVAPDGDAQVRFLQPRLVAGLAFSWSLDGAPQAEQGPVLRVLPRAAGHHTVAVNVTDAEGAWSVATQEVNYTDPGFLWGSAPPAVAPLSPPLDLALSTIHRAEGREEQLRNGDFAAGTAGWGFLDAEVQGAANWSVVAGPDGRFARIRASTARAGAVALQQDAARLCARVTCGLSLDYRSDAPLDLLLRERNTTTAGTPVDLHVPAPLSATWRHIEAAWTLPPNPDRLTLYLRALLAAGQSATVDFRNVSLEPALDATVEVTGPGIPQVRNSTATFSAPGRHDLQARVSNHYGQEDRFNRSIEVLPIALFPTPSGALGVRSLSPYPGAAVTVLDAAGAAKARIDLAELVATPSLEVFGREGQTYFRIAVAATDRVVLQAGGQEGTFAVADLRARFPSAPATANASTAAAGWSTLIRVRVATSDDALLNGTARILEGGREVAQVALARDGDTLAGDVTLPVSLAARSYTVAYELRDAWGEGLPLAQQPLEVPVNPLLGGGLLLLGSALLVAGAGWVALRWQRRERQP